MELTQVLSMPAKRLFSLTIACLPPFLGPVIDQIWRDSSPKEDDDVVKGNGSGVAGLKPLQILRHKKCEGHLRVTLLQGCMQRQKPRGQRDFSYTPYGLDFLDRFTGDAFFGGEGLRMRSTFQVRITCGWRGLSID